MYHNEYYLDGRTEDVHLSKVHSQIKKLCYGLSALHVDPVCSYDSVFRRFSLLAQCFPF